MKLPSDARILRAAAILALVALTLMVWGIFEPTAFPIMISMTLGQAIGTASFVMYLVVLARHARRARLLTATGESKKDEPR